MKDWIKNILLLEDDSKDDPVAEVGFDGDIEKLTINNTNYRKVLYTTKNTQLVLMSLKPGEEIGEETHNGSQFLRFEAGQGKAVMGDKEVAVKDGSAVVVPQGMNHNIINTSSSEDLKLYALYSPPQHEDSLIQQDKPNED